MVRTYGVPPWQDVVAADAHREPHGHALPHQPPERRPDGEHGHEDAGGDGQRGR